MATMITYDAPVLLRQWFDGQQQTFRNHHTNANLSLPSDEENLNKAIVTLETKSHVASITLWGSGMFEFIILDVAARAEVVVADREFNTLESIRDELDKSLSEFLRIAS
jgi:hypothetical protein